MDNACSLPVAAAAIEKYAHKEAEILDMGDADARNSVGIRLMEEIARDPAITQCVRSKSDVADVMNQIDKRAREIVRNIDSRSNI